MKKIRLTQRFLMFFGLGVIVETVRLLAFRFFQDRSVLLANFISVPIGVLAAFALYATFVWPDRPGSCWKKLVRFGVSKGITALPRWIFFPSWLRALPCPLYGLTHSILSFFISVVPSFSFLNRMVTCEWMSVASMDLCIALILGFYLNNRIVFAEERAFGEPDRRRELQRLLGDFGMSGLVTLSFIGIHYWGVWGLVTLGVAGYLLGVLVGAFYVAIARTGLYS